MELSEFRNIYHTIKLATDKLDISYFSRIPDMVMHFGYNGLEKRIDNIIFSIVRRLE